MRILLDKKPARNSGEPKWLVLHGGKGAQRRRWGPDMAELADQLVSVYGWVMWRDGADAHVKHRSMLPN